MLGRAPYHEPWLLASVDPLLFGLPAPVSERFDVIAPLHDYALRHVRSGGHLRDVTRHVLGLFNGLPGARRWRQMLSDAHRLAANDPGLLVDAARQVSRPVPDRI